MAVVYISEYAEAPNIKTGQMLPVGQEPSLAEQTVAIGVGSVQSAAFNAKTKFVRLHTDAICSVKFGSNPTATATTPRMAANSTEFFGVNPGDKVAIITNT